MSHLYENLNLAGYSYAWKIATISSRGLIIIIIS